MNNMRLSPDGAAFIKGYESCRLKAYKDQAGIWTIGWGHTGYDVYEGVRWTQMQADKQFRVDVMSATLPINNNLRVPISQQQFDALVSLAYNIGISNFLQSTLFRVLNEGNYAEAGKQFLRWNKSRNPITGELEISNGLTNRRTKESEIFLIAMPYPVPLSPPSPPSPPSPIIKLTWWEKLLEIFKSWIKK